MSLFKHIVYDTQLSDDVSESLFLSAERSEEIFTFFRSCSLFNWNMVNNDCEDRANAISLLLDKWEIPNYKAWVFGGTFLGKEPGSLTNNWCYHVAAALPVQQMGKVVIMVIDPATSAVLQTVESWAQQVAEWGYCYAAVRHSRYYIFPPGTIAKDNWFERCRQNYKWTIQGLAGINGVTRTGKAQLCFHKPKLAKKDKAFKHLLQHKPAL